jgi:hypothetical protein
MSTDYGKLKPNERDRNKLLELLMDMRWHTPGEMRKAGGVRYSARLLELKRLGYKIDDRPRSGEEQGKEYVLVSLVPGTPQKKRAVVYLDDKDLADIVAGKSMDQLSKKAQRELRQALVRFQNNREKL